MIGSRDHTGGKTTNGRIASLFEDNTTTHSRMCYDWFAWFVRTLFNNQVCWSRAIVRHQRSKTTLSRQLINWTIWQRHERELRFVFIYWSMTYIGFDLLVVTVINIRTLKNGTVTWSLEKLSAGMSRRLIRVGPYGFVNTSNIPGSVFEKRPGCYRSWNVWLDQWYYWSMVWLTDPRKNWSMVWLTDSRKDWSMVLLVDGICCIWRYLSCCESSYDVRGKVEEESNFPSRFLPRDTYDRLKIIHRSHSHAITDYF